MATKHTGSGAQGKKGRERRRSQVLDQRLKCALRVTSHLLVKSDATTARISDLRQREPESTLSEPYRTHALHVHHDGSASIISNVTSH